MPVFPAEGSIEEELGTRWKNNQGLYLQESTIELFVDTHSVLRCFEEEM